MSSASLQVMDFTSLRAVIAELRQEILPSRFEKAQQPESNTLQIGLRTLKGLFWLEISWRADSARLVQIPPPNRQGSESTLAKQFQHGLSQMALVEIHQKGFDRVVEFGLALRPGENIQKTLIIELMGRHSNVLLLDHQRRVITLGRQVRENQSRLRPIGTGDIYIQPPPLKGIEPKQKESLKLWKERLCLIPTSTFKNALQESYQGISPSLAMQIAHNETIKAMNILNLSVVKIPNKEWERMHKRWGAWLKAIEEEAFSIHFIGPTAFRVWGASKQDSLSIKGLSLNLGKYYRNHINKLELRKITKEIEQKIIRLKTHEKSCLKEQERLLKETLLSNEFQEKADKIFCRPNLRRDEIIEAQNLYRKSKKLRRSGGVIKGRIDHHYKKLHIIEGTESFFEEITLNNWEAVMKKIEALIELSKELDQLLRKPIKKKPQAKSNKAQSLKPLELNSPSGLIVQIGRNHLQNEWISLRHSRSGDLWFHAQECPGSHVVLKSSVGLPEEEDLQMASDLAAFFSRAKGNKLVPVLMVPTNQLERIPGATPGTVSHRKSQVLWGSPSRGLSRIPKSNSK